MAAVFPADFGLEAARLDATRITVEDLTDTLRLLVSERQILRARGAGPDMLEENRVAIVRRQQHLARALIARYRPEPGPEIPAASPSIGSAR